MLSMKCNDAGIEPVMLKISLNRGLTEPPMLTLIYMLADFGRDKVLHSFMSWFATQIQILTGILVPSKSSETMKMKSGTMATGGRARIFHSNTFLNHRWNGLGVQEVSQQTSFLLRRANIMQPPSHGYALKSFFSILRSALLCLRDGL